MLRNATYIYDKIIVGNKDYCKKAQVGVDLTIKSISRIKTPGVIRKDKTIVGEYSALEPVLLNAEPDSMGWFLPKGTYFIELNEGCKLGKNDTAYIIMRSSLNRNGVMIQSAVWDPGYECENMNLRMTVDAEVGVYIYQNARVCQILVFENEDTDLYDGQFQGGGTHSKLQ